MAVQDFGTAAAQVPLDLQVVARDIELTQNMDSDLEKMFGVEKGSDVSLQEYRHGIQFSIGGHSGGWQPDGGSLPQGFGPGYSQFIIAPVPVISA